ncbi:MAG: hypothetical protein GC154_16185 [bacterium]|nr:hypothetical protein [bacterium]
MTNHAQRLQGVFLPVTTPFREDMSVDYEALKVNVHLYSRSGAHGYLALGSNGENRCLREDEKRRVLETILKYKHPGQIVMAGCIYDSTPLTVEFMRFAKDAGADYATLLSPSYFRKQMTHETLIDYFTECAESLPLPVLLYNAPGFTGVNLATETVRELAGHPNIVGMKDSASEGIERFYELQSETFSVMAGSANFFYPSLTQGLRGGVVSVGNYLPEAAVDLWTLGMSGVSEEGDEFHARMVALNKAVSGAWGVPGVKCAMDLCGKAGLWPRKPLKRLYGDARDSIQRALHDSGLLSRADHD